MVSQSKDMSGQENRLTTNSLVTPYLVPPTDSNLTGISSNGSKRL